jgi:hypothetical protein
MPEHKVLPYKIVFVIPYPLKIYNYRKLPIFAIEQKNLEICYFLDSKNFSEPLVLTINRRFIYDRKILADMKFRMWYVSMGITAVVILVSMLYLGKILCVPMENAPCVSFLNSP